jgi:hypothetical protein
MDVHSFDPLRDPRWDGFVARHRDASIFHTSGWLRALQRTYRYEPIAFTTSSPADGLTNALVFCRVESWLTGRRLVSLPFSDHCEPLVESADQLSHICAFVARYREQERLRHAEIRPASTTATHPHDFGPAQTFYLHRLDLGPDLDALLRSFHKDSIQRKIRRAEREGLTYEEGRSEALLGKLADLLELTRRRHQVPRQPISWFRNLIDCLGDRVCIRVASKDARPIAAILTLAFRDTVVYKYGGSDASLHALGGMPFLFWKTIEQAKQNGARELDFGRSDSDNAGLVVFKDRWATTRSTLTYWRTPQPTQAIRISSFPVRLGKRAISVLPSALQRGLATLLYRHIG